jgi:hypothetical protein
MARSESSIEDKVVDWAKYRDIPCFKLKLDTNSGWPDRLFLLPNGQAAFIEFKRPKKQPRKLQLHRHQILRSLGYNVITTDNAEAAIRWLTEI